MLRLSIVRVADMLKVAWDTANDAGMRELIWFEGVRVIGLGEHAWRHTKFGTRYVTGTIHLRQNMNAPVWLLDMVPGRSKAVFANWLAA